MFVSSCHVSSRQLSRLTQADDSHNVFCAGPPDEAPSPGPPGEEQPAPQPKEDTPTQEPPQDPPAPTP